MTAAAAAFETDFDSLSRAVRVSPEDDAPRLALADWHDEHGQPDRARLIRTQIRLADGGLKCRRHGRRCGQCKACAAESWARIYVLTLAERGWHTTTDDTAVESRVMVYRRGFVSEVRLTCGDFVGGPCGRCEDRTRRGQLEWGPCPECVVNGKTTGRTPGLAGRLFAAQPVTRVVLTDRGPMQLLFRGRWSWGQQRASGDHEQPDRLPMCLFRMLFDDPSELDEAPYPERDDRYLTRYAALAALSAACVKYGRQLAGLEN